MSAWLIYSVISVLAWGTWGIVLKFAYSGAGWRQVYFFSAIASFLLALTIFLFTRGEVKFDKPIVYALIAGLLGGLGYIFFIRALETGKASVVIPLTALYPAVTAVLAVIILGEKLTPTQTLGILLAILAVYLLST